MDAELEKKNMEKSSNMVKKLQKMGVRSFLLWGCVPRSPASSRLRGFWAGRGENVASALHLWQTQGANSASRPLLV